jgi:hypothetical protein
VTCGTPVFDLACLDAWLCPWPIVM